MVLDKQWNSDKLIQWAIKSLPREPHMKEITFPYKKQLASNTL